MDGNVFFIFALVACACVSWSTVKAEEEARMYSETAAISDTEIDPAKAITAYDYRAMMLRSVRKVFQCWRCSSPCSAYACCNDGYPQCCLYNGRCMCCRI